MLAIKSPVKTTEQTRRFKPNILPCRINDSQPVNATKRYWSEIEHDTGQKVSYFRGRKLYGRDIKFDERYKGVIVRETDQTLKLGKSSRTSSDNSLEDDDDLEDNLKTTVEEEDDDSEEQETVKILQELGTFDTVCVWEHEALPTTDDVVMRNLDEWVKWSHALHDYKEDAEDGAREG
ncbi:hypothetical protein MMC25_006250 [Agyrium rufum]|nr:hypothetical protein [Agyrium rufum]